MSCYIRAKNTIPGITDEVYAVGKAIEKKMGIYPNEKKETYKQKIEKQEQKAEIKVLRSLIAKNSNEIYLRKQRIKGTSKKKKILKRRKGTSKKKEILKQFKKTMDKTELTIPVLMKRKKGWIDKLKYKTREAGKYGQKRQRDYG